MMIFKVSSLFLLSLCFLINNYVDAVDWKACKVPFAEKDGVCVNLEEDVVHCPTLRRHLLDKNFTDIHSAICEEHDEPHLNRTRVCCAVDEFIELYTTINVPFHEHHNFKLIPALDNSECGKSLSSTADRIIGGENVLAAEHPWMARLGMEFPGDDQLRFPCSGSIINDRNILTAAHCFKQGTLRIVRLAETDEDVKTECIEVGINSTICQEVEDYEPEDVIIHTNYTGKIGSLNDIALIRLKQPIRNISSPFTRPVCLPFVDQFDLPDLENSAVSATGAKNLVSVQGWGKQNNSENVGTSQLKQVYVPLRSNVLCRHVFRKANLTITDEQICVGGSKDKGSCAGDSGSPLLIYGYPKTKRAGMRMFQIGVVSYGRQRCGLELGFTVYTRVRSHLNWILDNIKE